MKNGKNLCQGFYAGLDYNSAWNYYCFNPPMLYPDQPFFGHEAGLSCHIQYFQNSSDFTDVSFTDTLNLALCGYNYNGYAYCPLTLGSQYVQNYMNWRTQQYPVQYSKCHALSTLLNCTAWLKPAYTPTTASGQTPKSWL